ncbi:aldehyde dehydrogenase family protein [Streptomyces sp. NPDC060002]|uniref:aldehyde dehydrogenase family protein n=1 Tax=Streptomyces sp. NPDC060002 TaxID=3347033 RepID=UPI0036AD5C0C
MRTRHHDEFTTGPYPFDELRRDLCGVGEGPGDDHSAGLTVSHSLVASAWTTATAPAGPHFDTPLSTFAHKIAPALAAGNAVMLKPAGQTPLCVTALVRALLETGLPERLVRRARPRSGTRGTAVNLT